MIRHFLRDDDLTHDEQAALIDRAIALKANPFGYQALAGPAAVAVLFDKPSTRTRVSFSVGIAQLGGYPLVLDTGSTQLGRGEPIADTARVLDRLCKAIVWRTFAQSNLEEMAAASSVPVVNGLSDLFHPCQILADLVTIKEHKGDLAGLTLGYVGDGANNVAHSLLLGCALAGMHVRIGTPASHLPDPDVVAQAEKLAAKNGGSVRVTRGITAALTGADVVVTDTWVSMGQEKEKGSSSPSEAPSPFTGYTVDNLAMSMAAGDAIVLHCLPAYRGSEIAASVIDGPQSVVFDEAENRLHAQKALLCWLVEQAASSAGSP
jgi:ornithine carbamoyltransferase